MKKNIKRQILIFAEALGYVENEYLSFYIFFHFISPYIFSIAYMVIPSTY
jgi:hypothetical protein